MNDDRPPRGAPPGPAGVPPPGGYGLGAPPPAPPSPFGSPLPVAPFQPTALGTRGPRVLRRPRLGGFFILLLAGLLGGINAYTLDSEGKFYPQALILTPVVALVGLWMLVTGQPLDPATNRPVRWWTLGSGTAAGIGLLIGLWAAFTIGGC